MIRFENVDLERQGKVLLNNLHFEIKQSLVIHGEAGSGKSTLLEAIAGNINPQKGIIYKSKNIKILLVKRDYGFHKIIGNAYQYYQQRYNSIDAAIGPNLINVLQNQILPLGTKYLNSVDLPAPKYKDDWVDEVCKMFNIEHLKTRQITSLSNGETRRSLLAYYYLQKPDVFLLDDPFSGLDKENREILKNILHHIKANIIVLVCKPCDVPSIIKTSLHIENNTVALVPMKFKNAPIIKNNDGVFFDSKIDFKYVFKLKNGFVKYGSNTILSGINWEIKAGEKWALLGHNGSGKSSLLTLFTGDNLQCYANDIEMFDKRRGTGESVWELKKKIGFLSPELHLYFNKQIRVWKVIASGFFDTIGLFQKLSESQEGRLNFILDKMGLFEIKETPLYQLSFGQQRMVFLARAILKSPPLLILDEPFQGLDDVQIQFCKNIIDSIKANQTLIFVSHYENELPKCINNVLELENGIIKSKTDI